MNSKMTRYEKFFRLFLAVFMIVQLGLSSAAAVAQPDHRRRRLCGLYRSLSKRICRIDLPYGKYRRGAGSRRPSGQLSDGQRQRGLYTDEERAGRFLPKNERFAGVRH